MDIPTDRAAAAGLRAAFDELCAGLAFIEDHAAAQRTARTIAALTAVLTQFARYDVAQANLRRATALAEAAELRTRRLTVRLMKADALTPKAEEDPQDGDADDGADGLDHGALEPVRALVAERSRDLAERLSTRGLLEPVLARGPGGDRPVVVRPSPPDARAAA